MKLNSISKYTAGVCAAALVGMSMSGAASAATFNATATVQNSLTVTNVADMNLGTLFATNASSGEYKFMTLSPAGTFGTPTGSANITLLSLGGGIQPAQASVAIGTTTPFTVTLPNAEVTTLATNGTDAATITKLNTQAGSADAVLLDDSLANPSVAYFQLVNFTVGQVVNGTADAGCATITDGTATCLLTPDFSATSVSFNVGAQVVTDVSGTANYQATTYAGSFDVTASY